MADVKPAPLKAKGAAPGKPWRVTPDEKRFGKSRTGECVYTDTAFEVRGASIFK